MADNGLVALRDNVSSSVQQMSNAQRAALVAAFVATAMAVFTVSRLAGGSTMKLLYADLEPKTAAAIVDELETQGIPYELTNNGRMIMVPAEHVHDVRLDMSAQDLPASTEGWSVLDNQGITTSQFDQRVGYQRAMEGELAKTIGAIDGVSSAKVHLVIPEDDLFVADEVAASASVLLLTGGTPISSSQVHAITNLVSSSVEGLSPERVSITDERGRVLAAPGEGAGSMGTESDDRLRTSQQYEAALEADLENLLSTVVGRNKAVVTVTADLEFDSVQTVTEQYQPTENADGSQTVLAETSRDEVYENLAGQRETGILGTEAAEAEDIVANGGDPTDADRSSYTLDERDATYAVNKVVTNSRNTPGEVVGLSVAVLLDEETIDANQLEEVQDLVAAAAGIDPDRGDTVEVSLLPMNEDVKAEIEAANEAAKNTDPGLDIIGLIRTIGSIVVALLVVFFGLRMVRAKPPTEVEAIDLSELEVDSTAELGTADHERAAIEAASAAALGAGGDADDQLDYEEELKALLDNQPDEVAGVLRAWLAESDHEEVVS